MTSLEDLLRETLAARAHDVDGLALVTAPPPRRSRRRWVAVGTVVAVAAALVVAVVLVAPWRGDDHRTTTPTDQVTTPPAGSQWLSFHGVTLTVPTSWEVSTWPCGPLTSAPGLVHVDLYQIPCPGALAATPATAVTLRDLVDVSPRGNRVTVAGHVAYRLDTSQRVDPASPLSVSVQLPDAGVELSVDVPSGDARRVQQVLDGVEYTPVDHLGCAEQQPSGDEFTGPLDLDGVARARVCEYAPRSDGTAGAWLLGSRLLSEDETDRLRATLATTQVTVASPSGTVAIGGFPAEGRHTGRHVYLFVAPDGGTRSVTVDPRLQPAVVFGGGHIGTLSGANPDLPHAYP